MSQHLTARQCMLALCLMLGVTCATATSQAGEIVFQNPPLSARAQAIGRPVAPTPGQGQPVPRQTVVINTTTTPAAYANGATAYRGNEPAGYTIDERVEDWKNYGGARIYWRSIIVPRQMRTGNVAFVDPASMPYLFAPEKKATVRRKAVRRAGQSVSKSKTQATQQPPANASSPRLQVPQQTSARQEAGTGSVPIQAGSPARKQGAPKVTTEVWDPVPPLSSSVQPLPFLKGN